jgi:3-phenylpropionate/trans-cinnamate dioxygenase ferredoxin reductase component
MAGARAVEVISRAPGRTVALVGAESHIPYARPPLSKELLRSERSVGEVYLRAKSFYAIKGIDLLLGCRAAELDPHSRLVTMDSGDSVTFQRSVLVATGCRPVEPGIPGTALAGVYQLRTLDDALRLRSELRPGRRLVVVGGGLIGSEVAATARVLGAEVDVVERTPSLLGHAFGNSVGAIVAERHRRAGVRLHLGTGVAELVGTVTVEQVVTSAGETLECDLVVVGIGVRPEIEWLSRSGLDLDDGVMVDEYCRAAADGVYSAGDVARAFVPRFGRYHRVEHETNAQNQAIVAARNMLGENIVYNSLPYVWSTQYDLDIWYLGDSSDSTTVDIHVAANSRLVAAYQRGDRTVAALGVSCPEALPTARRLLEIGSQFSAADLYSASDVG